MKKALATLLSAILMLGMLTGCGGSTSTSTSDSSSSGDTQATAASVKLPKNIEVQLPASAGGGTDVYARTLVNWINTNYDSNLTIINNTDGGGVVAFETIRTAKADASKILLFHTTMCIKTATGVYDYSAAEDFKIIGVTKSDEPGGYVLVVNADSGITSLDEFITAAKSSSDPFKIGVETGGSTHLMSGMLADVLDIPMNYVEAGPDTEKLTALVGNSIECALVNANQAKQYIEAGKINCLGCFSSSDEGGRCSNLPDVPSFIEQGYDLVYGTRFFLLGPKDMDDATAQAILEMFDAAALADETTEVLKTSGLVNIWLPYEDGPATLKSQQDSLTTVCEQLGLVQK